MSQAIVSFPLNVMPFLNDAIAPGVLKPNHKLIFDLVTIAGGVKI